MKLRRQFAVFLVALLLLLSTACEKQKPQLPAKMQAPTLAVSVPDQIPEIDVPPEQPAPQQEATLQEGPPKKAPPKHRSAKKPAQPPPANQANNQSNTTAVNRPPLNQPAPASPASSQANTTVAVNRPPVSSGAEAQGDTAIAAEVSNQTITRQKQSTAELIDSTEKDLKGLNRGLNHDEEAMLTQIKSYVAQSRKATNDGDFERAYNLAMKAHLLADALLKK